MGKFNEGIVLRCPGLQTESEESATIPFRREYEAPYGSIAGQAQSVDIAELGEIGLHLFFVECVWDTS